jgi:hypothetical protein
MWTHRRFTWHVPNASLELYDQVDAILQAAMDETPQFFHSAWIGGSALGVMEFGLTISDRDRWWVGRRARQLSERLRQGTNLPVTLVHEEPEKLPPHPNRGKYRLRRLKGAQGG